MMILVGNEALLPLRSDYISSYNIRNGDLYFRCHIFQSYCVGLTFNKQFQRYGYETAEIKTALPRVLTWI